jgi:hypothetical protein
MAVLVLVLEMEGRHDGRERELREERPGAPKMM